MPTFIPKNPYFKDNEAEQEVFNLLKILPDDCIILHEPNIESRRSDFIVFFPRLGVLAIEVKGWIISNIIDGDQNTIHLQTSTRRPCLA